MIRGVRGLTFGATDAGGGIRKVYVVAQRDRARHRHPQLRRRRRASRPRSARARWRPPSRRRSRRRAPAFVTGPDNYVSRLRRGPRARRLRQPHLRAAPGLGRQRLPRARPSAVARAVERGLRRRRAPSARGAPRIAQPCCAATVAGAGAGATVCALTRALVAGAPIVVGATATPAADGSYALELPPGPEPRGLRPLRRRRQGHRPPRPGADLSRAPVASACSPTHGVRNHDRLHFAGACPGPACSDRVVKVQAQARQAPLAGLSHRSHRRRLPLRRPLQAARHRATRSRYRFRALVPQAGRLPIRARPLADGQGEAATTPVMGC